MIDSRGEQNISVVSWFVVNHKFKVSAGEVGVVGATPRINQHSAGSHIENRLTLTSIY